MKRYLWTRFTVLVTFEKCLSTSWLPLTKSVRAVFRAKFTDVQGTWLCVKAIDQIQKESAPLVSVYFSNWSSMRAGEQVILCFL